MPKKNYQLHLRGYVGGFDFDRNYVDYVLGKHKDNEVNVLIDSLGGEVATALSIASAFSRHGNVSVHYVGMNASAATIASLGAKHVSMDSCAMYLVHKVSTVVFKWAQMNADQLRKHADEVEKEIDDLDKIDRNIASMYAGKCKKKTDELLALMKVGGWLTAAEAKEWGFVDEITELAEGKPVLDDVTVSALASAGIPIPDMPVEKREGSLTNFLKILGALFNKTSEKRVTMKKNFENVCKLLGSKGLDMEDGKSTLTEEELNKLEAHLADDAKKHAELEKEVNDLKEKLSAAEKELEAFKKSPANDTTQVNDDGGKEEENDYFTTMANASKLFNELNG